ncbi:MULTISPECIES: hypothetical protein [Herbaspirillum]|uniref:Uncharacterized protein n=1 Tax=Herbaspirillum huttiense subsp. lycopersici TaxID=3074428 RepID=A0ABU2EQ18_9BURK|nr:MULTISPECIES: hypothetical protein [Herbaspirillum]MCO4855533.1 hypothetical protein [Herbaspirillum sp. WGmk3]MDR6397312.1 hypothetical protein [Herbaspirillum seropedicae]MDR9850219.1 hypothetical protein [Herbaspirillum huttiense SE1]MDT0356489.1 hypothetical protein [Herbaspirillum huttiense F1]UWE18068.1 hypothetical protein NY669_07810 [Herbaspirillum huttiense]
MYDDPRHIRDHRIVIRCNADNYAFMKSLAQLQGENLATLAHDMMLHMAVEFVVARDVPIVINQNMQTKALKSHFSVPQNA